MDATCAIQNSIHVFSLVHINMCPGFWVHIILSFPVFLYQSVQEKLPVAGLLYCHYNSFVTIITC